MGEGGEGRGLLCLQPHTIYLTVNASNALQVSNVRKRALHLQESRNSSLLDITAAISK